MGDYHDGQPSFSSSSPDLDLDLVGFSLIVDDIVYWDGTTSMSQVGGGGPQALWGYAVAAAASAINDGGGRAANIALAAGVGDDLPPSVRDWLLGPCLGADLSGLLLQPNTDAASTTPRAWQILEKDGRRTQVWRVTETDALYAQLRPRFDALPARLRTSARSYHIGLHAAYPPRSLLSALRGAVDARRAQQEEEEEAGGDAAARCVVSAETYTRCEDGPLSAQQLRDLLAPLDVFSPNEEEAASMLGVKLRHGRGDGVKRRGNDDEDEDEEEAERAAEESERLLVDALLDAAAGGGPTTSRPLTITLRRGGRGALAKTTATTASGGGGGGSCVRVPAVAGLRVVDPVGCGNAFCGAFLAAVHAGKDLREAAAFGCAAGGTMAEHVGVPRLPLTALAPLVGRRARELALRVRAGLAVASWSSSSAAGVARRRVLRGV